RRAAVPLHSLPRLLEDVTPPDPIHQGVEATTRVLLGRDVEPSLQASNVVDRTSATGVVGPSGHALARTCIDGATVPGVLRSRCVLRRSDRHYYDPLGLPLHGARLRLRLIRVVSPRRG